jgi:hypothetical protein
MYLEGFSAKCEVRKNCKIKIDDRDVNSCCAILSQVIGNIIFRQCCNSYSLFVTSYSYSYVTKNITIYRYKLHLLIAIKNAYNSNGPNRNETCGKIIGKINNYLVDVSACICKIPPNRFFNRIVD